MTKSVAYAHLQRAEQHLDRAQAAACDPVDWADLSIYGFYALEAAVMAAALHAGFRVDRNHRSKAEAAKKLAENHELPDVADLLSKLNSYRKAVAYGDEESPELDPESVSAEIEGFVDSVRTLLEGE